MAFRAATLAAMLGAAAPAAAGETPKYGGSLIFMIPADAPPSLMFARHRPHRHAAASRAVNIMRLELILRAVDVPEPLQRIRAQGETEAAAVRRMHHAVRTDVEWLVEELPHHRHVALAHLENVAVGGCHRVNACGKQNPTAPGMWG